MRYIGNKENIVEKIYIILLDNNIIGNTFFDFFSGTTSVARFYKALGYKVFSSDIMMLKLFRVLRCFFRFPFCQQTLVTIS